MADLLLDVDGFLDSAEDKSTEDEAAVDGSGIDDTAVDDAFEPAPLELAVSTLPHAATESKIENAISAAKTNLYCFIKSCLQKHFITL